MVIGIHEEGFRKEDAIVSTTPHNKTVGENNKLELEYGKITLHEART